MIIDATLARPPAPAMRRDAPLAWSDAFLALLDRHRVILFTVFGAVYLLGFNGQWLMGPDSGLYLTLGRNLAWGRGYTYQGMPHELVYPGLPLVLAGLSRVFGSHAIFAADLFVLLCGFGTLALAFRLFYLAFGRPMAVAMTLGLGINYEFYRYCYEILTDVPFVMGVMALLAGHEAIFDRSRDSRRKARWWDWALLVGGLVIVMAMRPTMIGLLISWLAALIWSAIRGRGSRKIVVVAIVIAVGAVIMFARLDPRGVMDHAVPGSYEHNALLDLTKNFSQRLRHEILDNVKDLFGASAARSGFGTPLGAWWINAFFGVVLLGCGLALARKRPLWGMWVAVTILMLVLIVSHDRYMVEILPLIVCGWWLALSAISRHLGRLGNWLFILLIALGTGPNSVKIIGMIFLQHQRPFIAHYREGRYDAYVRMAPYVSKLVSPQDTVFCPSRMSTTMTYLTDRRVRGEFNPLGAAVTYQLFVVLDTTDNDFGQWLAAEHVRIEDPPLVGIPREGGKPPLLLVRASRD
jgi:hypothetical protein